VLDEEEIAQRCNLMGVQEGKLGKGSVLTSRVTWHKKKLYYIIQYDLVAGAVGLDILNVTSQV